MATWFEESTHWKRSSCWERLRPGREGATEDGMFEWLHWLNGHEFEQTPGDSEGQGSLACCSPWSHRVGHDLMTEQQPSTETKQFLLCRHVMCAVTKYNSIKKKNKTFAMVAPTRNFRATTITLWERYRFVYRKVLLCWFVYPQRSFLVGVLGVKLFRRPWGFPDSGSGDGRECVFVHVGIRSHWFVYLTAHLLPSFISYRWLNAESAQCTFPTSETFPNGPRAFERTPFVICISNFIVSG